MPDQFLDDLFLTEDGIKMPVDRLTWVTFEGRRYGLALTEGHRAELLDLLSRYTEAAEQARKGRRKAFSKTISRADRARNALIRDWAQRNGIELGNAGPIPPEVRAAFEEAQHEQEQPVPGENHDGPGEEGGST